MILRVLLLVLICAHPAQACRLALVLALDVSSSVDAEEYELQRKGLIWALNQDDVRDAIFAVPTAPVAIMVYEWSGRYDQVILSDWILLRSEADLQQLTARLAAHNRSRADMPTAIGFSLAYALRQFDDIPECAARTVDISGDGLNNEATNPRRIYEMFDFRNITVNGLAIGDAEIVRYYERNVIHGQGAFVEWARGYGDVADTMRRKLLKELGTWQLSEL